MIESRWSRIHLVFKLSDTFLFELLTCKLCEDFIADCMETKDEHCLSLGSSFDCDLRTFTDVKFFCRVLSTLFLSNKYFRDT